MKRNLRTSLLSVLILALLLLSAPINTVLAVPGCNWQGAVNANWSTPGNWVGACTGAGGIPGTGDSLYFPLGGTNTTMNDDLPAITVQKLYFASALSYTINGTNTISLSNGVDVQGGNQVINVPLAVLNNSVYFQVANGAALLQQGTLNVGSHQLSVVVNTAAGVTGMTIQNAITGGVDSYHKGKITKTGTGDLRLIGDDSNSYFDIDLNAGSISTDSAAATFLPYIGINTLAGGTNLNLLNSAVIGSIAGSGNIHATSFFQIRQYENTLFTGDLFGSYQMAIIGDGVLTIDSSGAALSYQGEININTGPAYLKLVNTDATAALQFIVNGNGDSSFLELVGSQVGTIKLGYPDALHQYSGTLKLSGPALNSASYVVVQAQGCSIESVINSNTDYGRLSFTSPVQLGSNPVAFSVSGAYHSTIGDLFSILQDTNSAPAILDNVRFSSLPQDGTLALNGRVLKADYQALGNTAFTLTTTGYQFLLPLVVR